MEHGQGQLDEAEVAGAVGHALAAGPARPRPVLLRSAEARVKRASRHRSDAVLPRVDDEGGLGDGYLRGPLNVFRRQQAELDRCTTSSQRVNVQVSSNTYICLAGSGMRAHSSSSRAPSASLNLTLFYGVAIGFARCVSFY